MRQIRHLTDRTKLGLMLRALHANRHGRLHQAWWSRDHCRVRRLSESRKVSRQESSARVIVSVERRLSSAAANPFDILHF